MLELKAGFARVDITPSLGTQIVGYYHIRKAVGVIDPLLASAVAFDDGQRKAVIISLDLLGINEDTIDKLRLRVAETAEMDQQAVFIACTHTHLGPKIDGQYLDFLSQRLCDAVIVPLPIQLRRWCPTPMAMWRM